MSISFGTINRAGYLFAAALVFSLFSVGGAWASECTGCITRKQEMCARECRLVPSERALECQQSCIRQYCAHRCDVESLNDYYSANQTCESCLDQQFNLCEPSCPNGSDRYRSACKLGCAKIRCSKRCGTPTPARTSEKAAPPAAPAQTP